MVCIASLILFFPLIFFPRICSLSLISLPRSPIVPRYAAIGAARRFYGWTLLCLGVSQFCLEDNELDLMTSHNAAAIENDFKLAEQEAQRKFLADIEKRKAEAKN